VFVDKKMAEAGLDQIEGRAAINNKICHKKWR